MVHQDLDPALSARIAIEGAMYRGRCGIESDSRATPRADARARCKVTVFFACARGNGNLHMGPSGAVLRAVERV